MISNQARFKFGLEAIFTGEDVRLHSGTRVTFSASVRAVDQLAMIAAVAQTVGNSSYSDEGNRPLCVREHPILNLGVNRVEPLLRSVGPLSIGRAFGFQFCNPIEQLRRFPRGAARCWRLPSPRRSGTSASQWSPELAEARI